MSEQSVALSLFHRKLSLSAYLGKSSHNSVQRLAGFDHLMRHTLYAVMITQQTASEAVVFKEKCSFCGILGELFLTICSYIYWRKKISGVLFVYCVTIACSGRLNCSCCLGLGQVSDTGSLDQFYFKWFVKYKTFWFVPEQSKIEIIWLELNRWNVRILMNGGVGCILVGICKRQMC